MKYEAPRDTDGNPYYVPIVAKNKDFLVGYISGLATAKDMIKDVLESINIDVDLGPIDVLLDSTRFNDILENGRYESEMTDAEKKDYIFNIVESVSHKLVYKNSENFVDNSELKVECSCGLGFYSWEHAVDSPQQNFACHNCGKILIHYTGIYDSDYEYHEGREND